MRPVSLRLSMLVLAGMALVLVPLTAPITSGGGGKHDAPMPSCWRRPA